MWLLKFGKFAFLSKVAVTTQRSFSVKIPPKSRFPALQVMPDTVHNMLDDAMKRHPPSRVALMDPITNTSYTYRQLHDISSRISAGLMYYGCKKGDILTMVSPNSMECALLTLAIFRLGAVLSGVNPQSTADELAHYFDECKTSFVLTTSDSLPLVMKVLNQQTHCVKKIFVAGPSTTCDYSNTLAISFSKLIHSSPENSPLPKVTIRPKEDLGVVFFSSGTTGRPKAVMLTHWNMVFFFRTVLLPPNFPLMREGDIMLALLPLFHIFGLYLLLTSFLKGVTTVMYAKYDSKSFLEAVEKHKVTFMGLVPPIMTFLIKDPTVRQYDLSSMRSILYGAAPCGKELLQDFQKRFPNVSYLCQVYGMTEGGGGFTYTPPDQPQQKLGSCGILVPNCQIKIVDVKTGVELGPNQPGEIWFRSDAVMLGYMNRHLETGATVDGNGWLHTGDVGYYDNDCYFYVVDRLKDLIKVKGFQVAPAELEDVLLSHAAVADAAVIGVPDGNEGEVPKAFVVLKAGATISEQELAEFTKGKVAKHKQLTGGIQFTSAIPKSASGKILKRLIKDQTSTKL